MKFILINDIISTLYVLHGMNSCLYPYAGVDELSIELIKALFTCKNIL